LKPVRLNLFWKLGFAFFALLIAALLPVDFYAERALRRDYERAGFEQLAAIARIALANPPQVSSLSPAHTEGSASLRDWVAKMAASGVRVTVITSAGQVLADSQSDPSTMENHAGRPEIRDALQKAADNPYATASPSTGISCITPRACPLPAGLPWSCVLPCPCKPWTKSCGHSAGVSGWHR
jgi:two-component system phosphate regulon sensor histidine kinase PhoR